MRHVDPPLTHDEMKSHIESIVASCTYETHRVPGTTTTLATAIAPNGFVLLTGESIAARADEFDEALGIQYAVDDAKSKVMDLLWVLEAWRAKCNSAGLLPD